MINIENLQMYVLVAPDGTPQPMTLSQDYAECIGVIRLLAKYGLTKDYSVLSKAQYRILPVMVSMTCNGTEEDAFDTMKESLKT